MDIKYYKNIFEQSSQLLVMVDTNFAIVAASDSFLKSTSTVRENIVGRSIFDVFPDNPDDETANGKGKVLDSFNRVLKNKTPDKLTFVKYDIPKPESKGGGFEVKYWHALNSPILDEKNNVKYIIQRADDVTENKELTTELEFEKKALKLAEDSEKRYNMLLMKSPFGFAVFKGKNMVITLANDSIKAFWGKGGDVEGKPLFDLIPELKDSAFPGLLNKVYTTGVPFYGDELLASILRNEKQEDVYFNFVYQPYLEADETISGVTVIAYEVTAAVLVKKALQAQHKAEQEAVKKIEESNKRYYNMLMHSPFAFSIMKGKEMVVTLANDLIKEFWGKGTDVEGKTLLQILPEIEAQPFPTMLDTVYSKGIPVYANEILAGLTHNGKIENRYFNVVYQPHYEADNTISGVITIAYDVTEQVLARKKIEESEAHFRLMADLMPAKISNADSAGNVTYFNKHWLDYTGYTFEELRDFGYHKIMHPDELEEFQQRLQKAAETKTNLVMEMRFKNKQDDYIWHLNIASSIKDANGDIKMWVGSTTDIHAQKQAKEELEKAVSDRTIELVEANKMLALQIEEKEKRAAELINTNKKLQSFTYASSHDLQEPLRKIQILASRVIEKEEENLSEKGKDYLNRMRSIADEMRNLIEDLLAYSQLNNPVHKFKTTDLKIIVDSVIDDLKESIKEKQATIEITEMCRVNIIPFQFRQLMYNLIGNALKFSSAKRSPHITLNSVVINGAKLNIPSLSREKNYCHISVTDNGIGFDNEYKDKIFEVFQRLHDKDEYPGTGIGLAIVKKIVENHHGIIIANGKLNEAAAFDIYIPSQS